MRILIVGSGGREHAIAWKLSQSRHKPVLHAAPGNGGIAKIAACHDVKATDIEAQVELARSLSVDFVFVAPDDPLALGLVDALHAAGIAAFGPTAAAARIESSKSFAKDLMKKYGIPTAPYSVFANVDEAIEHLSSCTYPAVVKADGLALGKGVVIAKDLSEAQVAVRSMMCDGAFGQAGRRIVIEEFLEGQEITVLAFTDGETIVPMVSSQDFKRAYDGDKGPNTGGMGAFAPSPVYTEQLANRCMREIYLPTIAAMQKEGYPFRGVLYFGLMVVDGNPMVIEYNARLGDPEAQVVLPLLRSDLVDVCYAVMQGNLTEASVELDSRTAACVVVVSGDYPTTYTTGHLIKGLEAIKQQSALLFHAGTRLEYGRLYTSGGRVVGVTCVAENLSSAVAEVYDVIEGISFEGSRYRHDVGRVLSGGSTI